MRVFTPKCLDTTAVWVIASRLRFIIASKRMSSEFTRSSTVAEILPGSDVESEADLKILQFNVGRATQKQINFAGINCRVILFIMSTATAKLLPSSRRCQSSNNRSS